MPYERELREARRLAVRAGNVQLGAREGEIPFELKGDRSPVTLIDRRCEELICEGLREAFPEDGILGEEGGAQVGTSGRTWIVDPLDGTRPFIRGIPTYSCLIALEAHEEPVVGVIHLAALNETYWASSGGGAFQNDRPIRVSNTRTIGEAMGSALGEIERMDEPSGKQLLEVMHACDYAYGFMDNYSYACVAAGRLDFCVNLLDKAWDCAAAACIVSEAGGTYSDIEGHKSVHNGSIILSNAFLHESLLARLS